tara:strand:+ start:296 stop:871 length:576 start_codon:yes stop_codon:yes gene_type:complete
MTFVFRLAVVCLGGWDDLRANSSNHPGEGIAPPHFTFFHVLDPPCPLALPGPGVIAERVTLRLPAKRLEFLVVLGDFHQVGRSGAGQGIRLTSQVFVSSLNLIGFVQAQSASMVTGTAQAPRLKAIKNIAVAFWAVCIVVCLVDGIGFSPDVFSGFQGFQLGLLGPLASKAVVAGPSNDQVERADEPGDYL